MDSIKGALILAERFAGRATGETIREQAVEQDGLPLWQWVGAPVEDTESTAGPA